ncbi:MAG: CBO0543 family protein [Heyndrickxia sp.]
MTVKKGYIKYPINLFKSFDIRFIFDYLLYPISCVYYNQITKKSNILGIMVKTFYFTIPMAVTEWNSFTVFWTLSITFHISRAFIDIVRKAKNSPIAKN